MTGHEPELIADLARVEPLVEVLWEDTTNVAAWQTRDEMIDWARAGGWFAYNVGYLVHEDAECVVLSARIVYDEERHVGLAERIPKRAIVKRRTIEDPSCTIPGCDHVRSNRGYDLQQSDGEADG